jgi:hypothetical protein
LNLLLSWLSSKVGWEKGARREKGGGKRRGGQEAGREKKAPGRAGKDSEGETHGRSKIPMWQKVDGNCYTNRKLDTPWL